MALTPTVLEHFSFNHLGRVLNIPVRLQRLAFLFLFLRSREQDEQ